MRVVVVVVFFTLTDRASTIPSNIRGTSERQEKLKITVQVVATEDVQG